VVDCYKDGNEPSASIKGQEFLDYLSASQEELRSMELLSYVRS